MRRVGGLPRPRLAGLGALPLAALLLFGAAPAMALEVTARLETDQARVGDRVLLSVSVTGGLQNLPEPTLPDLDADFEVLQRGNSRSFSFINGRMNNSLTLNYLLVPRREGTFTIAPITVATKDEEVTAEPVKLTVSGAAPAPAPPSGSGEENLGKGNEEIFVRATVDETAPHVYEQVTYRVKFYTRLNPLEYPDFKAPTTQGLWREDLPPREIALETVKGKRYRVFEKDIAVFPTAPGKLTIGASEISCLVEVPTRGEDPFSLLFRGVDGRRVTLRTDPILLEVQPLPAGAPASFRGGVGEYTVSASLDRTEASQNEPITLTVKVTGEGHIRSFGEIEMPPLPDFRVYPSQANEEILRQGSRIAGTLTRQFVLVPLSAGRKEIPSIPLSAFSPRNGRYQTLDTRAMPVTVRAGAPGVPGASAGPRGDIELVGRDIRFIETAVPDFMGLGGTWARARAWLLFLPVPLLGYAAMAWWERRRERLGRDVALRRRLRAARAARRALKDAGGMAAGADRAAAAAVALRGYIADRFNLPQAGLLAEDAAQALRGMGMDPTELLAFLDRCDAARYAPGVATQGVGDRLAEASRWVDLLERKR